MTPTCPESEGHAEPAPPHRLFLPAERSDVESLGLLCLESAFPSPPLFFPMRRRLAEKRGEEPSFSFGPKTSDCVLSLRRPAFFFFLPAVSGCKERLRRLRRHLKVNVVNSVLFLRCRSALLALSPSRPLFSPSLNLSSPFLTPLHPLCILPPPRPRLLLPGPVLSICLCVRLERSLSSAFFVWQTASLAVLRPTCCHYTVTLINGVRVRDQQIDSSAPCCLVGSHSRFSSFRP